MNCHDIQQKLSAYIEGIIPPEERMLIEEHLKSCSTCNESLVDLKRTMSYIHDLEDVEPPAWLREKVMSRIKTETEPKRGFFQKLFYPLHIKLPIEAVAVLFIAVAALYIFKAIQPEVKIARAPSEVIPQIPLQEKETPQENAKSNEIVIPSPTPTVPIPLEKALPPSPSATRGPLEKVTHLSPPLEKTIPSFPPLEKGDEGGFEAGQTMLPEKPATRDKLEEAPQVPAPLQRQNKIRPSAGAVAKDELKTEVFSRSWKAKVSAQRGQRVIISIRAKDIKTAREEIEMTLIPLEGKLIKTESSEKEIITGEIDSQELKEFIVRLKSIGEVDERDMNLEGREGTFEILIEIVK